MNIKELKAQAREAIKAGDLDLAEKLTAQAKALAEVDAVPEPAVTRLNFGAPAQQPAPTGEDIAVKTWYQRKYGETSAAAEQIATELYGTDYKALAYAKHRDFARFLRSGQYDPALKSVILLTANQILDAAVGDVWMADIKTTIMESVDTLGGYAVPEDFREGVISRLPGMTVVRAIAGKTTTNRDRWSMLKRTGGNSRYIGAARSTWTDEKPSGQSATESGVTFGKVEIPVHVNMINLPITRSALEDSGVDLVAYVRDEITSAMAIDEDEQFLVGSGAGRPQGVLNGTAASGAPFSSDITTVSVATTPSAASIISVPMKIDAQYRQDGSVWVAAKATYEAIYSLLDGSNRPLWRHHDESLSTPYPKQLQGYDIKESEAMPAIGTNKYPMIFGNFKRGYQIVDRVGMSLERYQDSGTVGTDTVQFYARRRLGGQVVAGWAFCVLKTT